MTSSVFLDSNVLIYSYSDDPRSISAKNMAEQPYTISVQVLNEFAYVSRRKFRLEWSVVRERSLAITELAESVVSMTSATHSLGLHIAERYRLQVYDGTILASALEAGCDTLYSEDMHDGLVIEGALTIRNPFA